jgi:hypothetical protein
VDEDHAGEHQHENQPTQETYIDHIHLVNNKRIIYGERGVCGQLRRPHTPHLPLFIENAIKSSRRIRRGKGDYILFYGSGEINREAAKGEKILHVHEENSAFACPRSLGVVASR